MRGLHWRMIREDALLEAVGPRGSNRTIRIEGIPLRIDNRDAVVVALALHTRASVYVEGETNVQVQAREMQRLMHGNILLPGRNSVGLVPTTLGADAIGILNAAHGLGNCGMVFSGLGGLIDDQEIPALLAADYESTLILPYAPRALSVQRDGTAGAFDGAIDAALFDLAPPTLSILGLGQRAEELGLVVEEIQTEVWVCLATCEPGEALGPTRPQMLLLGDVVNNPQHYGVGDVSDVQTVALLSVDPSDKDALGIWNSAAQAAVEVDGTEITEGPWRAILRMAVQEGLAGFLWQLVTNASTALLMTPASLPKASERHVGSRISIEGYPTSDREFENVYAVAYVIQAPEREVLATWAQARNVDLSTATVHGEPVGKLDLDDRRFVGISPVYSRR